MVPLTTPPVYTQSRRCISFIGVFGNVLGYRWSHGVFLLVYVGRYSYESYDVNTMRKPSLYVMYLLMKSSLSYIDLVSFQYTTIKLDKFTSL